jgi:hypothetical protein
MAANDFTSAAAYKRIFDTQKTGLFVWQLSNTYHSTNQTNDPKRNHCITFVGGNSWSLPPNTVIRTTKR